MKNFYLYVFYTCKPGKALPFVQAIKNSGIQEKIRGEDGCLRYDYLLSCEAEDTVVLMEQWRDAAAQEKHMTQPHMEDLHRMKDEYVLDVRLERLE